MSTFKSSAILTIHARSGCDVLVHHLLTVEGFTPSCSESHLLVRFFSTSTNFRQFTSSIWWFLITECKDSDFFSLPANFIIITLPHGNNCVFWCYSWLPPGLRIRASSWLGTGANSRAPPVAVDKNLQDSNSSFTDCLYMATPASRSLLPFWLSVWQWLAGGSRCVVMLLILVSAYYCC